MKLPLALVSALAGVTVAEEVVSLLLFGVERDAEYEASVIDSDATATTYSIDCPASTTCDLPSRAGITAEVVDSSTYAWWIRNYGTTWACTASATDDAACHRTISGEDQGITASFTNYLSVTVTDATGTPSATSTSTSTSTSASATEESSSSSGTPTPTTEAGEEDESETSTGGVPKMTGAAGLVFGGAAVALMGAVL
ncbi:hypothetical protein BJY01DRAFT_213168 [Aspergillus pseudoustus]|uniref:GPI anchored protein n=1 Tax=Aspergillus pseudoustus TaxID=1810923 RepID=A0ABR4K3L1_9EURO